MATAVYSTQVATMTLGTSSVTQQPPNEEQYFSTFFCRALYDYQTDNESSLSFRKDDIIEVLTKLESGWWDGLLGQERGWFPSNYVTVISDQEADAALSAAEAIAVAAAQSTSSATYQPASVDMPQDVAVGHSSHPHDWERQLQASLNMAAYQAAQISRANGSAAQSSDFWVPQVSPDGRIYYMNTQTGQQSRDLPQEVDQDMSDVELVGLSVQPNARQPVLGLGASTNTPGMSDHALGGQAGFGVPARTGTPEPWRKILADDGMSYYYLNTVDNTVSWTLPSTQSVASYGDSGVYVQLEDPILSLAASSSDRETTLMNASSESLSRRLRSDSAVSQPTDRSQSTDRYSIHSDDSDVQPALRGRSESSASMKRPSPSVPSPVKMKPRVPQKIHELTTAEQSAQSLQRALAPPPPDSVNDLSAIARGAIGSVVQYLQSHDVMSQSRYGLELNERVLAVVHSVRNLLYVSATPSGHIPSSLYSRDARHPRSTPASQTLQTHLKPAQRKVAGTLSKLVLSTLAIQYDSGTSSNDKPLRMEVDASELERAIVAFVSEVQRFINLNPHWSDRNAIKRLHGVFSVQNIGMGLPGAGAAASWKGFGWQGLDEMVDAPNRRLSIEVVTELKAHVSHLEAKRAQLIDPSSDALRPLDLLAKECHEFIRQLNACILFICNIHVARHVDIDGRVDSEYAPNRDLYLQTVDKARHLVRTLEVTVQALYDVGSAFLLAVQTIRSNTADSSSSGNPLSALSAALKHNLDLVSQTFEALLTVGHDQAELGQDDYNGSIDWRMSRVSIIDSQFGDAIFVNPNQDGEQVVDIEQAFRSPGTRAKTTTDSSEMFSQHTSKSLEASLVPMREPSGEDLSLVPSRLFDQNISFKPTDLPPPLDLDNDMATFLDDESPGVAASKSPPRGAKLRKILGDDAPQAYIDKVNADLKKWYLRSDYSASELLTDPEGTVRGGTLQALVECLTTHDAPDTKFNATFLMTYKSFTTTNELFDLLTQRFWIQPLPNLNPQELEEWKKLKQHVVRARVLNTFKSMIVDDDIFDNDDTFRQHLKEFVSQEEVIGSAAAKQLMIHIERAQRGNDIKVTTSTPGSDPPASIIPKASKSKLKLGDVDPTEMARQLTLLESQLYQKIRPIECLQRSREQRGDTSDNISAVIQFANRIANWVADAVLAKEDSRRRATVVKHFISIADRCQTLHNFSSMVAIVSGLNTPPIRRLKRTWEQVPTRFMTLLSGCETAIDTNKNFGNYRKILAQIIPPCVPFIGVFLTQLTFINENPNTIGENLVNFRKRQKTAEVIQDIKRWQSIPYNFRTVQPVVNFIEEALSPFNDGQDLGDHFWNLSLEREPREREDEKMARLLQESGFL